MACSVLGILLTLVWVYLLERPDQSYYTLGCVVFGVAGVLEMLAEPPHIYLLNHQHIRAPIVVELVSSLTQTAVTVIIAHFSSSLLPFIVGMAVYSCLYITVYWILYILKSHGNDTDRITPPTQLEPVSTHHISLTISFFVQTILKQVLTMGEEYVMTFFSVISFAQQGVFSTVSKLAAIVVRVGFKHVEDSYYVFFAQMIHRGIPVQNQSADAVATCRETLGNLLRFNSLFGIIVTIYGMSYARVALLIYGGYQLANSEGPMLLLWHCPYIAVCGINGVSECYYFATMSQREVERYNWKLLPFSVCFLALSVCLSYVFGSVGFIMANIGNMLIRITFSMRYICQYFGGYDVLHRAIPSVPEMALILVCGGACLLTKFVFDLTESFLGHVLHVIIGGLSFVFLLNMVWQCEDASFKNFLKSLSPVVLTSKADPVSVWRRQTPITNLIL
eukprot:sb/3464668/